MVNLLTELKFQGLAVSKNPDLLTGPVFQGSAVSKKPVLLTDLIFRRRLPSFSGVPNVEVFCLNSKIPDIFHPASITPGSTCLHLVSSLLTPAADLGTHSRAVGGTSFEADSLPPIILSYNPQHRFPDF